ncbi:coiled-coil domain-containing protein [Sinosporangium siamense]|uniref:coiled-coil domain-containing protein n=1 Tax=Sinosporangium siamense TaxID=1367973 RepID=UPI00194FAA7D|nr:hypothetical protein [Sinosporangium siamense]
MESGRPGKWGRAAMRVSAAAAALMLMAVGLPGASALAPALVLERHSPDRQSKIRRLTLEAAALSKAYRGEIRTLDDARDEAKKADRRADRLTRQVAGAERELVHIARTSYMSGGLDAIQLFGLQGEATQAMSNMALVTHLAGERAQRTTHLKTLLKEANAARKTADQKIDKLERDIAKLKTKRRDVERLLAKFGFQEPDAGSGLTARMVTIRNEIMANFPMPYGVGCLRPGDPGEHGKGRACDFMTSPGGRVSTGDDEARGDALAQWCINNGRRLGIMYIIWKQRYYDIRTGGGWDTMSDRGGATANHYDHVHVSVL